MDHPERHNGPQEGTSKGGKWMRNLQRLGKKKDLMDKISHLHPDNVEKAINLRYQRLITEFGILMQDCRIDQFENKSQAEIRNDYTTRTQAFNPGSETGWQGLTDLEEWGKQMKAHIEQVISTKAEPWQKISDKTNSDIQTSWQEVKSKYGHLIDSEQRGQFDTIIKAAKNCKQRLRKLGDEYHQVGKVAIGTDFDQKMIQALDDFQQSTNAIRDFQNGLEASETELNNRYKQAMEKVDKLMDDPRIAGFQGAQTAKEINDAYQKRKAAPLEGSQTASDQSEPFTFQELQKLQEDLPNHIDEMTTRVQANPTFHGIDRHLSDLINGINENHADTINTLETASQSEGLFDFRRNNAIKYRNEAIAAIGDGQDDKKIEQALSTFRIATNEIKAFRDGLVEYKDRQEQVEYIGHLRVTTTGSPEASSASAATQVGIGFEERTSGLTIPHAFLVRQGQLESTITAIKESYTPVLGISENLTQELLDYRTRNAEMARNTARDSARILADRGTTATIEETTKSQRFKLALYEVTSFQTDLSDIPLPNRLAYAQKRFNSAQGWFTQNEITLIQDRLLVDEMAEERVRLRNQADENLERAKQYEDINNTGRHNISNIEESYRTRVIEAENSVHEYVRFQENLKILSE